MIWINGPFGGGKTTTAEALVSRRPELRTFDPEHVGYLLMSNLAGLEIDDFQDLAAWRELVPIVARHLAVTSGQELVAVQTVLDQRYWRDLRAGLAAQGMDVVHVVLDAEQATLERRIERDEESSDAHQWRLDHIDPFVDARSWLYAEADLVVDTTTLDVDGTVDLIVESLG